MCIRDRRDDDRRVTEIAEPFGVVAAVVPSTNPTSTAIYKLSLIHISEPTRPY